MRLITKHPEPPTLTTYRESGGTWADFSLEKGKRIVKESLLREQFSLCAYCTQRIRFDRMKIEHYFPRTLSDNEKIKLIYGNLLACCPGLAYGGDIRHCDTGRPDRELSINPQRPEHIRRLSFNLVNGKLSSSNPEHQEDIDKDLNLNNRYLRERRVQHLLEFKKLLEKQHPGRTANARRYMQSLQKSEPEPFQGIVLTYLRKRLHRS